MYEDELKALRELVSKQGERIEALEKVIEEHYSQNEALIQKEVASATFHQVKALQHRIDQFLFDAKITLKNFGLDLK
jgi:hypothetical protein